MKYLHITPDEFWNYYFRGSFLQLERDRSEYRFEVATDWLGPTQHGKIVRSDLSTYKYASDPRFGVTVYNSPSTALFTILGGGLADENIVDAQLYSLLRVLGKWRMQRALDVGSRALVNEVAQLRLNHRQLCELAQSASKLINEKETQGLRAILAALGLLACGENTARDIVAPSLLRAFEHAAKNKVDDVAVTAIWSVGRLNAKSAIDPLVELIKHHSCYSLSISKALRFIISGSTLTELPRGPRTRHYDYWTSLRKRENLVGRTADQWKEVDSQSVYWEKRLMVANGATRAVEEIPFIKSSPIISLKDDLTSFGDLEAY